MGALEGERGRRPDRPPRWRIKRRDRPAFAKKLLLGLSLPLFLRGRWSVGHHFPTFVTFPKLLLLLLVPPLNALRPFALLTNDFRAKTFSAWQQNSKETSSRARVT